MILENKTEVTVPAVMAMQKAMNRQGQLAVISLPDFFCWVQFGKSAI